MTELAFFNLVEFPEKLPEHGCLFLSGLKPVSNENKLKEFKISLLVSVMNPSKMNIKFLNNEKKLSPKMEWLKIFVEDLETSDMSRYFNETTLKIAGYIFSNKNVLVHCENGKSRAPTLIMAFLIRFFYVSFESAQNTILKSDPTVSPNFGFRVQLKEFERFLKIKDKIEKPADFPTKEDIRAKAKLLFIKNIENTEKSVVSKKEISKENANLALEF